MKMEIENLIKTTTQELEKLVATEMVVGKPQTFEGKTLIPVSKISFGFGAGGGIGEGGKKEKEECGSGEGGGGGAGGLVEPIAFVVVDKEGVNVYQLKRGTITTAIDALTEKYPDIVNKGIKLASKITETKKEEKKK